MVGLAELVNDSLLRHGVETHLDPNRLRWSRWLRCEDALSMIHVPGKPGLYALAEEVIAPGELSIGEGKRMLALFQISETGDLGMALGRMFLPGSPQLPRFASGRCFARYAVIEDVVQRRAAHAAFCHWMASSAEIALGLGASAEVASVPPKLDKEAQNGPPPLFPSGF